MARQQALTPDQHALIAQITAATTDIHRLQAQLSREATARAGLIQALHHRGLSIRRIASELGMSAGPIQDALRRPVPPAEPPG